MNSCSAPQVNHPRLTNVIYKNVSSPSATHIYNGRALVLTRGTKGFIEFAKILQQNKQTDLTNKKLSLLENAPQVIQEKVFSFLDPASRACVLQTASPFHKMKEASLKGRNDLVQKFVEFMHFDLSALSNDDIAVLQEAGASITALTLLDIYLSEEKLEKLVRLFPRLLELNLNNCLTTDAHLSVLKSLKNLSSLEFNKLNEFSITNTGLEVISQFTRLKKLSVESQYISDNGIRTLAKLSKLEFLSLSRADDAEEISGITRETLKELGQNLKNLRTFRLANFLSHLDNDDGINEVLVSLSFFTNLEELIIDNCAEVELADLCYEAIGKLHKLRNLKIYFNERQAKALEELSKLSQLQKLEFEAYDWRNSESSAKFFLCLSQLTDLTVEGYPCSRDESECLFELIARNCTQLKRLCLRDKFQFAGEKFHELTALAQLERLEFKVCGFLQNTILDSLDQFQKLDTVVISNCPMITNEDIEKAKAAHKGLPNIEYTPPFEKYKYYGWWRLSDNEINDNEITDNDINDVIEIDNVSESDTDNESDKENEIKNYEIGDDNQAAWDLINETILEEPYEDQGTEPENPDE